MSWKVLLLTTIVLVCPTLQKARADDPGIPARCRPAEAVDNPSCAEILMTRFIDRNTRLNKRDAQANADLQKRILASRTVMGQTVSAVLDYAVHKIPFSVVGWHFVYARSGAEYVVLEYSAQAEAKKSHTDVFDSLWHFAYTGSDAEYTIPEYSAQAGPNKPPAEDFDSLSFFDNDLEKDPAQSLQNSRALGYVVWKVDGNSFLPWGSYANMLALGPEPFVWAVNDGRNGFKNSGYDPSFDHDFSFFSKLSTGEGKLSDHLTQYPASHMTFYWNVVEGFVVQSDHIDCPSVKVGIFTLRGKDCEARAEAFKDVAGKVLPFQVIRAIRNHGYTGGIVAADVSISVVGGGPGDWMATAVFVAEHAIIRDVTFATVAVYVPNPWGDSPPQHIKLLAKAYFAPNPARSPWKEKWSVFSAKHAASLADIEYDKLSNDLIEDPAKVPDPDVRLERAEKAATKAVIRKYGLPTFWQPSPAIGTDAVGIDGNQDHDRDHILFDPPDGIEGSMAALAKCLTSNWGNSLIQGCMPHPY